MLPRIKPRTFYDLVIEVAIVRPGPIQGDMVHPYLRRREGKEAVVYPRPELERVLGKTLGVPLFQEQAMRVAIECAGFTPSEADQLRRAMATFKFTGGVAHFKDKLISGMIERGYPPEFAEKTFTQLEGFGSYGFPESHAASFALIAYASSWMKCWHPDVFCAAIVNAQPMGFYAPAQLIRDARDHGVEVRPIDINKSRWDCTLEAIDGQEQHAVRLGFRLIKGIANRDVATLIAARADTAFSSVDDVWRRSEVSTSVLEKLANADAFQPSLHLERRDAIWAIRALRDEPLPLFAAAAAKANEAFSELKEEAVALKAMTAGRQVVEDYVSFGLTLRRHPITFIRPDLDARGIISCQDAGSSRDGRAATVAGLVLIRQRPGSAKGVLFMTIEDETGIANIVVWPDLFERQRRLILSTNMVAIKGRLQREGEVVHLVARELEDLSGLLKEISDRDQLLPVQYGRGDGGSHAGGPDPRDQVVRKPRDLFAPDVTKGDGIKVQSRDFH
jgi:error-prone DNA polymerase